MAGKILFRDSIGATLMQIDSAGTVSAISQTGSQGWSQNGVSSVMNSGYVAGSACVEPKSSALASILPLPALLSLP